MKISSRLYRVAFLSDKTSFEYNNKETVIKTLVSLIIVLATALIQALIFFTMEKTRSPQYYQMLWDSKGDYYDKKSGKPLDNSGFTVAIYRTNNAKIMGIHIWLGNGKETSTIRTKRGPFEIGKKYTLVFNYDGKNKYSVTLDGKVLGEGTVAPGGAIGQAIYKPTIGNRSVGSYFPFDGKIYSVKMVKK